MGSATMVHVSASKSLEDSFEPQSPRDDVVCRFASSSQRAIPLRSISRLIRWLGFLLLISLGLSWEQEACADAALDEYNLAVSLYKQSRWKQAAEQFRTFVKSHEKHEKAPLARLYLGLTLVNLEDYKQARIELRRFADENKSNPNYALARYRIGECSYLLNDLTAAQVELDGFVKEFPDDSMCEYALPYLGDIYLRSKEPETALKVFNRAIEQFPRGKLLEDARFGRARSLEGLKQFNDAIALYQELASEKNGAHAAEAQFNLSGIYVERHLNAEAIAAYATLTTDFPKSSLVPVAYMNAGYVFYRMGKFDEATQQFEAASKDKSQAVAARLWQGRVQKSLGEYAKAISIFKTLEPAAEKHPLLEAILYEHGLCERYLQHPLEARGLFSQVLSRFSQGDLADDSLYAIIDMSIEAGDLTTAEQNLVRFQKDYPESGLKWHIEWLVGRLELAKAGVKVREKRPVEEASALYASAAGRFETVLKESSIAKTRGHARYYLALTRQLQGNPDQAIEVIAPLVEQANAEGAKSDFVDAIALQADSYLQLKKFESAADSAVRYLDLAPKGRQVARALSVQALAAENLKDAAVASAALKRLANEFTNSPLSANTVQQLAELAESKGDWPAAGQRYETLASLQKEPEKKAYALRGIAFSQYYQNQFVAAAAMFGRVVSEFPQHVIVPECTYYQADSLKRAGQIDNSLLLFQKLFDTFPKGKVAPSKAELEPPLVYPYKAGLQVARIHNKANKVVEADAAYDALLTRFPHSSELDQVLDEWAIVNYHHHRYDQSDVIWRRLIDEVPDSPKVNSAKLSLAESDLNANNLDQAQKVFEELLNSDKSTADVKEQSLYQLVVVAVDRQRWEDVLLLGDRLTTEYPKSNHRFYVAYAQTEAYLALPKPSEQELAAVRERLKLLEDEAANDEINSAQWFDRVWVLLAELNYRERRYPEVVKVVEQLKLRNPKSPFLYQAEEVLGRSYKQQPPPKFDEARAAFERCIADPFAARTETAAKAQFMIGDTYFLQEKWDDASLAYQKVYSIYKFPEWQAAALLWSAKCDENQNEWKSAVETYKLLIKEFPDASLIDEAKTRFEAAKKRAGG